MASSNIAYCTDADLLDVYPNISGYDLKRRIYGWETTATSNLYVAYNVGEITLLYANGRELTSVTDTPNVEREYNYDADTDKVQYFSTTTPNDKVMEAGEDWETIKTRFRKRACRLFESEIDSRFVREISKDREGNYPDVVIRACALRSVILLMKAHDPENTIIAAFQEEYTDLIEGIRSGTITLPNSITQDSGKGVIREVSVNPSTTLRPVGLLGTYSGALYDLIQVKITTAGAVGTARYTSKGKTDNNLKSDIIQDAEIIDGDYQPVAPGLYIRFSAAVIDGSTDVATINDEYEIEVFGYGLDSTVSHTGSISLTRR